MATANLSLNPLLTTNAAGAFNVDAAGLIQGTAFDDPAVRNYLAGGILASTETTPMWGGVAITENIPTPSLTTPSMALGGVIARAASSTAITGFSVFNQAHAMLTTPQSPVPMSPSGGIVNFYRIGSGARIALAIDPSLVSLEGGAINQNVSWDFNNQRLQPYVASGATESVSSMTWSNANGGRAAIVLGSAGVFGLGDTINISGATNTGSGGAAAVNGNFVIDTYTDSTHFTVAMPAASGVIGTIAGTIVINVGTGALNVKILKVEIGNSLIVNYNSTTGYATWNRSGSAAVVLI